MFFKKVSSLCKSHIKSPLCFLPPTVHFNNNILFLNIFTVIPLKAKKMGSKWSSKCSGIVRHDKQSSSVFFTLLFSTSHEAKHEWRHWLEHVSTLDALDYSFRKKNPEYTNCWKQSVYHFTDCQYWDNGCEASAISGKLHLNESAAQCSKCVALNELALKGEFP